MRFETDEDISDFLGIPLRPFLTDMNAIIETIGDRFPDHTWSLGQNAHHGYWSAYIRKLDQDGYPEDVGIAHDDNSPNRALIMAVVAAFQSKER